MEKTIGQHTFTNWGAHCDGYQCAYLTAAAAIGMKKEEVDLFAKRLDKTLNKFKKRCEAKLAAPVSPIAETVVVSRSEEEVEEEVKEGGEDEEGERAERESDKEDMTSV